METHELKTVIISMLEKACLNLYYAISQEHYDGRIQVPRINGKHRISEQELKHMFIELFLTEKAMKDYTYSAEAPTTEKYTFSHQGNKDCVYCGKGRKGNIDLTIFKDDKRICLIEFKAGNPDKHRHAKDFCKLKEEKDEGLIKIFAEVYCNTNNGSLKNIKNKLFENGIHCLGSNTEFIGFSLNHNGSATFFRCLNNTIIPQKIANYL